MYVCMYVCVCACVHVCVYVCAGREIIFDKTKYMHSEDSDKLVYLSSLISLHLCYMGNEHNTSFKLLVSSHQNGQTYPSNCYAYIFYYCYFFSYLFIFFFFFGNDMPR